MRTISIRDLRAPVLRELAQTGALAAITDNRVLAGIYCPITQDWLTHTLTMNRSRLRQSVQQGEKNLANLDALPTLGALDGAEEPMSGSTESTHRNPIDAVQEVLGAVMGGRLPRIPRRPKITRQWVSAICPPPNSARRAGSGERSRSPIGASCSD